jgi:hypothetical protein
MDSICGVIEGDQCGFAHWIDMSYKGKEDQLTSIFYHCDYGATKFKELCKELGIETYEYPVCTKCHKPIYGCFSWDNGNVCMDCNNN